MLDSRLVSVFILTFVTLVPISAVSSPENADLDRVAAIADLMCPYNVICREGEPRLTASRSDRTGCCTDCSCADDCGLKEDCCYPQLDRYNIVDRRYQRCIYPFTTELQDGMAYNMVVDDYPNGTGEDCYTEGTKCGDDQTATQLGALYPVFSPKTGRIYANMKCARCHGLNDDDVIVWKAYLACDDSKFTDVSTYVQFFADGIMTPSCSFKFSYPGPLSDLKTEQCHRNTHISTCHAEDFIIPEELNMTLGDITDACKSDLISPVFWNAIWYKNVFCRLCSGAHQKYVPEYPCVKSEKIDGLRMQEIYFIALIDLRPKKSYMRTAKAQFTPSTRTACSMTNESDCRYAYCPSGKIQDDQAQCQHLSQHWRIDGVGMYLKLIPKEPVTLYTAKSTNFSAVLANTSLSVSPWSNIWTIERFMTFPRTDAANMTLVEYFLVRLRYEKATFKANSVLSNIDDAIKKDWYIYLNGSFLAHRQDFSEYKVFNEPGNNVERMSTAEFAYYDDDLSFVKDIPVPKFEILYGVNYKTLYDFNVIKPFRIVITKMFFCDQILLKPEEYQMDPNFIFLQLNATGRIFYPSEIAFAYNKHMIAAPKVCSSDVGFELVSYRAGAARATTDVLWLSLTTIALIIHRTA